MTPQAAPSSPAPGLLLVRVIGLLLLGLLLVLAVAGAALWQAMHSERGSAWLLSQLPRVVVSGTRGALLGDFEAEQVLIQLSSRGDSMTLSHVGWRGLRFERSGDVGLWLRVAVADLHAARIDLQLAPGVATTPSPLIAPSDLRLPLELEVASLAIDEVHASALGDQPLRNLQLRFHLSAESGGLHRVDDLSLAWGRLQAKGSAQIATRSPLRLAAQISLTQDGSTDAGLAWSASLGVAGPLQQAQLRATVRASPRAGQRAQSLDARATLRPFEAWPLADLQASTRSLDLSLFHRAAPVTALSGEALLHTTARNEPATLSLRLANGEAGRWNEGRLPLRNLTLELHGRPDDPRVLELQTFAAELGTQQQSAGRIEGHGRWTPQRWALDTMLTRLQPSLLDARAAAMPLSGPLALVGAGFDGSVATGATVDVKADLAGQVPARPAPRPVQLKLDASLGPQRIDVRDAQALSGSSRASLSGRATRTAADAAWHLQGHAALAGFDPLPWWPGREDSPWRRGPHRLNAKAEFDLSLPPSASTPSPLDAWSAVRGRAALVLAESQLAGVPLSGSATVLSSDAGGAVAALKFDAAGNTIQADGRLSARRDGSGDRWDVTLAAPALNRIEALWRLVQPPRADVALAGALTASAHISGRWPRLATQGEFDASALVINGNAVQRAQAHWQVDSSTDAAVDLQATLTQLLLSQTAFKGSPPIESVQLQLKGTVHAHSLDLRAESRARPPAWTDALRAPASAAAASAPPARTLAVLQAQGGMIDAAAGFAGWRGNLQQAELREAIADATPWLRARDVAIELQWAAGPTRATVQPGRAELFGSALRWSRISWQGAFERQPAQIEAQAELEPLAVAPLLARVQPEFGWGGDLAVAGHVNLRSAPAFSADVVLERHHGDLTVTDELGTQALGLTDLRVALDAHDGVWNFTQALAGNTLGVAAGAVVARTSPQATWPAADTPIQGVLEVRVANLGTWGNWVPAGWRLTGALRTSASIGGRFGAPEYTGEMRGSGLGVRNFLQGVNVSDGDVAITLQGSSAHIERFSARAGSGTATLEGSATLGVAPKAQLKLHADRFQLLGRVDRRIVASGQAELLLDSDKLALDGKFSVDEGLFDFTRSDAPQLSDDVDVVRRKRPDPARGGTANGAAPVAAGAPNRNVALDLQVALGERLRVRGRGIDTGLRGELRITSPGGRLSVNGTVQAVDGTYAAYGQKLTIDRGVLGFNGPVENPRLDIEATRPNIDVRVGVLVTGSALNPRVRLFSEPELSDIDKLSWLVLGRASDGLGRTDTALLQRAALALLSGENASVTSQFMKTLGLDDVSLRQTDGEVRETVVSLGRQLSRRWYVGYERGLNATTGTWQLIYRVARRFTLRAQSGLDNSLDVIWTWRWQ